MKSLALAIPVLALVASQARAGELVHRSQSRIDAGDTMQVSIPKFDPAMGKLLSIRVRIAPRIGGRLGLENLSREARFASAEVGVDVSVHYPADSRRPLVESSPRVSVRRLLDRLDGTVDYGGRSGVSVDLDLSQPASRSLALDASGRDFFTLGGSGGGRSVSLPVVIRPHEISSGPWLDTSFQYRGEVEVTVVYVYSAD